MDLLIKLGEGVRDQRLVKHAVVRRAVLFDVHQLRPDDLPQAVLELLP